MSVGDALDAAGLPASPSERRALALALHALRPALDALHAVPMARTVPPAPLFHAGFADPGDDGDDGGDGGDGGEGADR
ncbi:hypothetical protein GCM10009801_26090 [Streptomyces albiaxialis]|uniref:DUF4089 domain-containing protein n=1 Tax=Streptomyces albiaxialis TaxID=329523 RepID=A0ABN2VUZ8_9ACTN